MSNKIIVKVVHLGQGRKIRIDTLTTWQDFIDKMRTKIDDDILQVKDLDGDIIDDLDVLSHGDTLYIITH